MQYKAEVKRYDPDEEGEATFDTWNEAAEWLLVQRRYFGWSCNMWVNGDKVKFHGPHLVNVQPEDEGKTPTVYDDIKAEMVNTMTRPFRPQPTRGSIPTNPATFAARGEEV